MSGRPEHSTPYSVCRKTHLPTPESNLDEHCLPIGLTHCWPSLTSGIAGGLWTVRGPQEVGKLHVVLDGKALADEPVVVLNEAPEGGFFKRLGDGMMMWFKKDEAPPAPSKPDTK